MSMNEKKVTVKSMTNAQIGINYQPLNLRREWRKKGSKVVIKMSDLEEAIFADPGIEYMFSNGLLYIDDMEVKKELGLEPYDAEEPENIIILTDKEKAEVLASPAKLTEALEKIPREQKTELAEYAIEKEIVSVPINEIFKDVLGIDVINAIRLRRMAKEPEPEETKRNTKE